MSSTRLDELKPLVDQLDQNFNYSNGFQAIIIAKRILWELKEANEEDAAVHAEILRLVNLIKRQTTDAFNAAVEARRVEKETFKQAAQEQGSGTVPDLSDSMFNFNDQDSREIESEFKYCNDADRLAELEFFKELNNLVKPTPATEQPLMTMVIVPPSKPTFNFKPGFGFYGIGVLLMLAAAATVFIPPVSAALAALGIGVFVAAATLAIAAAVTYTTTAVIASKIKHDNSEDKKPRLEGRGHAHILQKTRGTASSEFGVKDPEQSSSSPKVTLESQPVTPSTSPRTSISEEKTSTTPRFSKSSDDEK